MQMLDIMLPENLENMQLPAPELVNYYRLAENRIFYVDFEIDMSILEIQKAIICINVADRNVPAEQRVPIKVFIDSPGGLLVESMSLATVMAMSKTPVITVNIGEAYSGGAILLLAGHKRYGFPYSKALLHTGSGSVGGTFEQTEQAQKNYKKQVAEMGEFILQRSGMDEKLYKKNKSKDWYLDAQEQINTGIIHEIVTDLDMIL
jgi:ATP-dependent Clp protease protease subunit